MLNAKFLVFSKTIDLQKFRFRIQQLRREIEKDEITPKRVDIVELNYGEFSGTENV